LVALSIGAKSGSLKGAIDCPYEGERMSESDRDLTPPPSSPGVRLLLQLRKAGQAISLSINDTMSFSVQDDNSFEKLLDLVDLLDRHQAIRDALREFEEGKGLTLEQIEEQLRVENGVPH
jgi:hypothetical protein